MRLLRSRRRDGVICVSLKVFGYEIEKMMRQGLVRLEHRFDRGEIENAIGTIVEAWFMKGK